MSLVSAGGGGSGPGQARPQHQRPPQHRGPGQQRQRPRLPRGELHRVRAGGQEIRPRSAEILRHRLG